MNIGNFKLGSTFDKKFTTRTSAGTPVTFAGSPAVAVYKDNSTTESTIGLTLTIDFDGRVGFHNLRIIATDAFYTAGNYDIVVTSGTVDGVNVAGETVFSFSLEARHPSPNDNADGLLKRDWTAVTGEAARSCLNAFRFLRNRWNIAAGTLTVRKEDDTAVAWTGATTAASGGDPIDSIDPS